MNLDNSNKRLKEGVVRILRDNVDGWSINEEHGVPNVWPSSPPEAVNGEFPRGIVDIISGNDFDLSVDLGVRLREVTLKVVVFSETPGPAEELIDETENAIVEYWDSTDSNGDPYTGDWSYREVDGFTSLTENRDDKRGVEGVLRYNRSIDIEFETVKIN